MKRNVYLPALCAAILTVTVMAADGASSAELEAAALEKGREYTTRFYANELAPLHEIFTEEWAKSMNLAAFKDVYGEIDQKLGREMKMLSDRVETKDGYLYYTRRARFQKLSDLIELRWVMNQDFAIAGIVVSAARLDEDQR